MDRNHQSWAIVALVLLSICCSSTTHGASMSSRSKTDTKRIKASEFGMPSAEWTPAVSGESIDGDDDGVDGNRLAASIEAKDEMDDESLGAESADTNDADLDTFQDVDKLPINSFNSNRWSGHTRSNALIDEIDQVQSIDRMDNKNNDDSSISDHSSSMGINEFGVNHKSMAPKSKKSNEHKSAKANFLVHNRAPNSISVQSASNQNQSQIVPNLTQYGNRSKVAIGGQSPSQSETQGQEQSQNQQTPCKQLANGKTGQSCQCSLCTCVDATNGKTPPPPSNNPMSVSSMAQSKVNGANTNGNRETTTANVNSRTQMSANEANGSNHHVKGAPKAKPTSSSNSHAYGNLGPMSNAGSSNVKQSLNFGSSSGLNLGSSSMTGASNGASTMRRAHLVKSQ